MKRLSDFEVYNNRSVLYIVQKNKPLYFITVLSFLFSLFLCYVFLVVIKLNRLDDMKSLFILFSIINIILWYVSLASIFNRTKIKVLKNLIKVYERPFPQSKDKELSFSFINSIDTIQKEVNVNDYIKLNFYLEIVYDENIKKTFISSRNKEEVDFIKEKISSFFGLTAGV